MESASLNVFQRLTRHWDSIHPYNAAQAMKLVGPPDHASLERAWQETVTELGVASLRADERRVRWDRPFSRPAQPLMALPDGSSLDQAMTIELNRRFDETLESPFRPFILHEGDRAYVGIVYHHWAADSYSIRLLLREWFLRIYHPARARRQPISIAGAG